MALAFWSGSSRAIILILHETYKGAGVHLLLYLCRFAGPPGDLQIIEVLQIEPKLRVGMEVSCQTRSENAWAKFQVGRG